MQKPINRSWHGLNADCLNVDQTTERSSFFNTEATLSREDRSGLRSERATTRQCSPACGSRLSAGEIADIAANVEQQVMGVLSCEF